MTKFLLLVGAAAAGLLLLLAAAFRLRSQQRGRAGLALELCETLDAYLDDVDRVAPGRYDAEALWARLESARQLKRQHFPELFPEMLEVSKAHGELTQLLLKEHMERHGAPTGWDAAAEPEQRSQLEARLEQAVRKLQARCRTLAGLPPNRKH
jgi:hypothetical protein